LIWNADFIPILRIRNGSAEIVHAEQSWQSDDTIILLSLPLQTKLKVRWIKYNEGENSYEIVSSSSTLGLSTGVSQLF